MTETNHEYSENQSLITEEERIQRLLPGVFAPGPSFHFVMDFSRFAFSYISESISTVLEVSPEEFNLFKLSENVHPEDKVYFSHCVEAITNFRFRNIPLNKPAQFKVSFQYRLRRELEYRMFLHQALPIAFDQQGRMNKTLCSLSDITHITRINNRKMTMIGYDGLSSYYKVGPSPALDQYTNEEIKYSRRELQVLRLISEGSSNETIADLLDISVGTVRTHRKNILAKSNAGNSVQAVAEAIRRNLI